MPTAATLKMVRNFSSLARRALSARSRAVMSRLVSRTSRRRVWSSHQHLPAFDDNVASAPRVVAQFSAPEPLRPQLPEALLELSWLPTSSNVWELKPKVSCAV